MTSYKPNPAFTSKLPNRPPVIVEKKDMESFFNGWVSKLEQLLAELLAAFPSDNLDAAGDIVARVLAHYEEYYREKSRLAAGDVLAVFSPTWLTPYERSYLWIAGYKPSLAFRLLDKALGAAGELSAEQTKEVARLQMATAREEKRLSDEMVMAEEGLAAPRVLRLVRGEGVVRSKAVEPMVESLKLLVGAADALRMRTAAGLVEILNPVQSVSFLSAAVQLHLRLRGWKAAA